MAAEGSFTGQEQMYESHRTTRDYIWNSVGLAANNLVFPLLTMVITQVCGAERAGMFSLAFVTGFLLMFIGNYGVRTYQVSDIEERHSFADYQITRVITSVIMLVVGLAYCAIRGYEGSMLVISIGVYVYKMVDGLADVYEGRLQQTDKMYLAGVSQALRSVLVFVVFTIFVVITRNIGIASVAMAVAALASFFFLSLPLGLLETPRSRYWTISSIRTIFKQCFPLFLGFFLYNFIDNMPKFVMEGVLSYDSQLYFNALYFPSQMILIIVQLIYKPLLLKLSGIWQDPSMRKRFNQVIAAMFAVTAVVTVIMILFMGWLGLSLLNICYGIDFEPYRLLCYIMLAAGGVTAAIDFLYQVITVLRRQQDTVKLYLVAFVFSIIVPLILINLTDLSGAIVAYLLNMVFLFVLLLMQYVASRRIIDSGDGSSKAEMGAHSLRRH